MDMDNQQTTPSANWMGKLKGMFVTENMKNRVIPESSNNRRDGETYEQWGTRVCGIVTGGLAALPPFLQKVYHDIYKAQATNAAVQQAAIAEIEAKIDQRNSELNVISRRKDEAISEIDAINKKIEKLEEEQTEVKQGKEKVNKNQLVKLRIGLTIIILLTVYLFLFYSSTFYSAFFRDPEKIKNVMNAMFDSQALVNAYNEGLAELIFVVSAPIIFMGLGYVLHFFSVQEGQMKYLKMGAILLVTVLFDCILAYMIGKNLHEQAYTTGFIAQGEYNAETALTDIKAWAVIFCGFIVYVIWGIVFDMCLSAYEKLDLSKTQLEKIQRQITGCEHKKQEEKEKLKELEQQELDKNNHIKALRTQLAQSVFVNTAAIKTEMNNFFAGWIKMMHVLALPQEDQDKAQEIYNQEIETLIK